MRMQLSICAILELRARSETQKEGTVGNAAREEGTTWLIFWLPQL